MTYPQERVAVAVIPEGASFVNFPQPAPATRGDPYFGLARVAAMNQTPYATPFAGSVCSTYSEKDCAQAGDLCFHNKVSNPSQCSLDWCKMFTKDTIVYAEKSAQEYCDCSSDSCQLWDRTASQALEGIDERQIPIKDLPFPEI